MLRRQTVSGSGGTRPGLHGQTLISMGLVDLDKLLGGGLPLGSLLLLLEDAHSQQHLNIIKYFLAEGLACGQRVQWLTPRLPVGGAAAFIPSQVFEQASTTAISATGSAGGKPQDDAEALKIAWQYRKYIQKQRQQGAAGIGSGHGTGGNANTADGAVGRRVGTSSFKRAGSSVEAGISRQWCHTYDLTKPMGAAGIAATQLDIQELTGPSALSTACQAALAFVSPTQQRAVHACAGAAPVITQGVGICTNSGVSASAPVSSTSHIANAPLPPRQLAPPVQPVSRLVIESAGAPSWGCSEAADVTVALMRMAVQLRLAVADARAAVLMTCPAGILSESDLHQLQHLAHVVLILQPLADNSLVFQMLPESTSAVALLSVSKLNSAGMVGHRPVDEMLHVVRNRRKRIALSPVEVDPDAELRMQAQAAKAASAAGTAEVGSGVSAGKGAASLVCGGPSAKHPVGLMDF